MSERLNAAAAAARAGISAKTLRAYVSRRHPRGNPAPAPVGYSSTTGEQVWDADELDAWIARRPGAGARTDMEQ